VDREKNTKALFMLHIIEEQSGLSGHDAILLYSAGSIIYISKIMPGFDADKVIACVRTGCAIASEKEQLGEYTFRLAEQIVRKTTGGIPEADQQDLVSRTVLACVQSWPTFNGLSSYDTWVWTIALHKRADYFRARTDDLPLVQDEEEDGPLMIEPAVFPPSLPVHVIRDICSLSIESVRLESNKAFLLLVLEFHSRDCRSYFLLFLNGEVAPASETVVNVFFELPSFQREGMEVVLRRPTPGTRYTERLNRWISEILDALEGSFRIKITLKRHRTSIEQARHRAREALCFHSARIWCGREGANLNARDLKEISRRMKPNAAAVIWELAHSG
jgi:DNA-directed RNA polymerase specialized sigma24 family protein